MESERAMENEKPKDEERANDGEKPKRAERASKINETPWGYKK
ncbi:hypothetical protein ES703_71274 [subsurface metagenome]